MKKLLLLPVLGMVLFGASCKKKDDDKKEDTPQTLILGKWSADYNADDENYNGILDESEKHTDDALIEDAYFFENGEFLSISQYEPTDNIDSVKGTYTISNDGKILTISSSILQEPSSFTIDELTSTKFVIKNSEVYNNRTETYWSAFKR